MRFGSSFGSSVKILKSIGERNKKFAYPCRVPSYKIAGGTQLLAWYSSNDGKLLAILLQTKHSGPFFKILITNQI